MAAIAVADLSREADERMNDPDTRERMTKYEDGTNAYFNKHADDSTQAVDASGRTTLRSDEIRDSLRWRARTQNLIPAFVDDFISIKGTLPMMTVDPAGNTDPDFQEAVDRSLILQGVWDTSRMVIQAKRGAFYLSACGDAPHTLDFHLPPSKGVKQDDPRYEGGLKPPGVYITVNHPGVAFPTFRTGYDAHELDDLLIVEEVPLRKAKRLWPEQCREASDDLVKVINYYSRDEKVMLVNGEEVHRYTHSLGFCPAQWVKNKEVGALGQSDIGGILGAHEEMQIMQVVTNDSIIQAVYPQTWIKDVTAFPDRLPTGPNAVIPIGPTGSIGQLAPAAHPQAGLQIVQQMMSGIEQMVGSAPVRTESKIDQSNTSSRAIHAVQGPMENRMSSQQDVIGTHYQSLNAKIMLAYFRLPEFKNAELTVYVPGKKDGGAMSFTGEKFGGWWRNTVDWDAFAGSTRHERIVAALQLQGAGVVSKQYVAEQAGVRNPEEEAKKVFAEKTQEVQMQAQMQPPPGGPPGPSSPGGPPGGDPSAVQAQTGQPATDALSLAAGGGAGGAQTQPAPTPPPAAGPGSAPGGDLGFPPVSTPPGQPGGAMPPDVTPIDQEAAPLLADVGIEVIPGNAALGDHQAHVYEKPDGPVVVELTDWHDSGKVKRALKQLAGRKRKVVAQIIPPNGKSNG